MTGRYDPEPSSPRERFMRKRSPRRARRFLQTYQPTGFVARLVFPLVTLLIVAVIFNTALAATVSATALVRYADQLPPPHTVGARDPFKTTKILDRTGGLLWEIVDPQGGRRTRIRYEDVPPHIIAATLAAEDADFFENPGFEPRSIIRAFIQNLISHEVMSGASTITQQLVRNTMIPESERLDQSYTRKLKEIILAFQLTQTYPKQQILEMYLNNVYYGNLSYGIAAAAESYFGKSVGQLDLAEAAMLAGLPQAPSAYNPLDHPNEAKARQWYVLTRMVQLGYISFEQAQRAADEQLQYRTTAFPIRAPHFSFWIQQLLERQYGPELVRRGGLTVITSLDPKLQDIAERVVKQRVPELKREYDADNAALVAMDPQTGEILAMVGSADYFNKAIDGEVNVAISPRQPGSSIKPLVYTTAFEKLGYGPETIVDDTPLVISSPDGWVWAPQNWDYAFHGRIPIKEALGSSFNIPVIRTLQQLGIDTFLTTARALGIKSFREGQRYGLAIAIGGAEVTVLEQTTAYAALANGGFSREPRPILAVYDGQGRLLDQTPPISGLRLFSARAVQDMANILSDDSLRKYSFGLNSPLKLSRPAAAKTGTTDQYKDAWTMGYTPQLVAGVWVGNTDGRAMRHVASSRSAGLIWHDFMELALADQPVMPLRYP